MNIIKPLFISEIATIVLNTSRTMDMHIYLSKLLNIYPFLILLNGLGVICILDKLETVKRILTVLEGILKVI